MKNLLLALFAMLLTLGTASAHGDGHHHHAAPPLKSKAVDAIKQGDFDRAAKLFPEEIAAQPGEARLKTLFTELKTQIRREKLFAQETDPEMIAAIGRQMRRFYVKYGLFAKAEPVDRKIYAADASERNAVSLGVTLLNLRKDREAAEIFGKLDLAKAKPGVILCAALAFARIGEKAKCAELLGKVDRNKLDLNGVRLYVRCAARSGDAATAAELTAKILEQSPAADHDSLKKQFFAEEDFKPVAESGIFRKALQTVSKIKEDDCGGCPNFGTDKCQHRH